ncbi:hypothetical protein QCA50_003799 [Cerrena zonata]|uniref:Uncharacterized protein n=1 Tax=Cerrena zonata TaxID=2478898 RepID=A0AAW0GPL6_9APHY
MTNFNSEKSQLPSTVGATVGADELPSYQQLHMEQDLKQTFTQLILDHQEIQRLFSSVSATLANTPHVGAGHDLYIVWDCLWKRHDAAHRASQRNASKCAQILEDYTSVLVPLSKANMDVEKKAKVINIFMEDLPVYEESARNLSTEFRDLAKLVEIFPATLSSYLAGVQGVWERLWSGLGSIFQSVWSALSSLARTFQNLLSCIGRICVSAPCLGVTVRLSSTRNTSPQNYSVTHQVPVADGATVLTERLAGFEDAWHLVSLKCDNLLQSVKMAGKLSAIPKVSNAVLKNAEMIHLPLQECLSAYANGKAPL